MAEKETSAHKAAASSTDATGTTEAKTHVKELGEDVRKEGSEIAEHLKESFEGLFEHDKHKEAAAESGTKKSESAEHEKKTGSEHAAK